MITRKLYRSSNSRLAVRFIAGPLMQRISLAMIVLILMNTASLSAERETITSVVHYSGFDGFKSIRYVSSFGGYDSAVKRNESTVGYPSYDYSAHLVDMGKDSDKRMRLFWCGRWKDSSDGDHILQAVSPTGAPGTWTMPHNGPDGEMGVQCGGAGTWWASNICDPEVLYSPEHGRWYMYTQVMIRGGWKLDDGGTAEIDCDRLMVRHSKDCSPPWIPYGKRGIVINLDRPARTYLHHHEIIYVPWDETGKKYWLYVNARVDGKGWGGQFRIRSASPLTFDWQARERVTGFTDIGNQIGYLKDCPGGPLFIRIFTRSFTENGPRVPSIQISRDGLNWVLGDDGPPVLAGPPDSPNNKNCFFCGFSTYLGQGPLLQGTGDRHWTCVYAATTSIRPTSPTIWKSEIGVGCLDIYVE